MKKNKPLMKLHLLIVMILTLSCTTACPQLNSTPNNKSVSDLNIFAGDTTKTSTRIKWTWQLPILVRNAFNKSQFSNWYVQKMIRCDGNGKTIYRFYLNNGNLLDGDHYDNLLKTDSLDITVEGKILSK